MEKYFNIAGLRNSRKILMALSAVALAVTAFAAEITAEQSGIAVDSWMKKYGAITGKSVQSVETITNAVTGAKFHVAMLRGGGFVVTAADDRILPVMAYSETDTFVNDPQNPLLQLLQADASAAQAAFCHENPSVVAKGAKSSGGAQSRVLSVSMTTAGVGMTDAQKEWVALLGCSASPHSSAPRLVSAAKGESASVSSRTEKRVAPFLGTQWGQTTHNGKTEDSLGGDGLPCFNYYTPEWPDETAPQTSVPADNIEYSGEEKSGRYTTRYPCGCVATAGAQIMKKWKYPRNRFSFDDMPDMPAVNPSARGRKAIGELTRAIGRTCGATYGPETGMSTKTMVESLFSVFSYAGAFWQDMSNSDFASTGGSVCNFDRQVIPNLIAGWPVSMSLLGHGGHSVVIDGLRYVGSVRSVHINFGWFIKGSTTWYVPQTFDVSYETWDQYAQRMVTKTVVYSSVGGIGINIHPTERKAIIAGRVIYRYADRDEALSGAKVVLTKQGSQIATGYADAHGQFYFLVDSGTYELAISKTGFEAKSIQGITVFCNADSVSNYYKDIDLDKTTATAVATPNIEGQGLDNGEHYSISMSCATAGATIHYTTDGTEPAEDDPIYNGSFVQYGQGTMTIKAKAFKDGMLPSGVCSVDFSFAASCGNTQLRLAKNISTASGRTAMDNTSATKENGEPDHSIVGKAGGASMWVSFTAPEDGDYTFAASGVSAEGEDYSLDTQLAVYTGDSIGALSLVVANDDVDAANYDLSSRVAFHATKGTTYKIAIDTRNGAKGTICLEWKQGREDVASPVEYNIYCSAEQSTYSIPIRSTAAWRACDGSDWITVKNGSGNDGDSLTFELPEMTEGGTRSGVLMVCAGNDGPSSTIKITQGTTSWVASRADALAAAKSNGKRILMVCGRDTNSNTSYLRFTACEDASVKPLLLDGYVLWYCDFDEQWDDFSYYANGLGSYALPLVCIIDPVMPEEYVARSTGGLTEVTLKQLLDSHSEGELPTTPFEVSAMGDDVAGAIAISYAPARRAQSYEIWRSTKWNPADAVRIASDVRSEEYVDGTAEPSVLYYYRVRAVNGVGASEMSATVTGCWRNGGAAGDSAIGNVLGAPHLDWKTDGNYPWIVQETETYDNGGAMQSAFVDPSQSGVLSVLKTTVTGPTRMSFRYKTRMYSSRFVVSVDGAEAFLETAYVPDWTAAEIYVPSGSHEIAFSYEKGGYYTSGFNGVYLDTVQFDVLSLPPVLAPATTADEDSALTFEGSLTVALSVPEDGVAYYTLDGSEPTAKSRKYEGPFAITASTLVKATCVQPGYDCSAVASGLYLERHPVQAGEWTTDVEGAKKAALKNGTVIVTLFADYATCYYSQLFKEVSESSDFLAWAKANGVYLVTADSSRWVGTGAAEDRFWDLFDDAGQSGYAYYPALAISSAWEPDKAIGYALARSGQKIGNVQYDGTVSSLEAGLRSFFAARPSVGYVWIGFDGNGGTSYEKSRVKIAGQAIGELPSAYRSYFYLDGWFTSPDGGVKLTANTVVNGDMAYYAHWRPAAGVYTVTYSPGSCGTGSQLTAMKSKDVALALKGNVFTRSGYTQTGWAQIDGGAKVYDLGASYVANADVTLYPYWTQNVVPQPEPVQSTVIFDANGGRFSDGKTVRYVVAKPGNLWGKMPMPSKSGQVFDGFYTAVEGGDLVTASDVVPSADATYYARWTPRLGLAAASEWSGEFTTDSWCGQGTVSHDGRDALRSGIIYDGQNSYLMTKVTGPGTLTFWWAVSCESGKDALRLLVDGSQLYMISGDKDWTQVTVEITGSGTHTIKWNYTKNGSVTKGEDFGWVDQIAWTPYVPPSTLITAAFYAGGGTFSDGATVRYVEAKPGNLWGKLPMPSKSGCVFDGYYEEASGELATASGLVPDVDVIYIAHWTPRLGLAAASEWGREFSTDSWCGQGAVSHDGKDALRSGIIYDGQSSCLVTRVPGPGTLTFWWKVSCEAGGNDALRFLLDGSQKYSISGEKDWTLVTVDVTGSGTHVLKWNYTKNGSVTKGEDFGWIDQIGWTPAK